MPQVGQQIEAIWRMEAPRLIGGLSRLLRDVGLAEDMAQEALVRALEIWPEQGIPDNPGAWLMATAKRRGIDMLRRHQMIRSKQGEIAYELEAREDVSLKVIEAALDDDIGDERLALIFTACHPVLGPEARAALTLKVVGGLSTAEIARAYLCPEPTIAQRIVRAKKTLRETGVIFAIPAASARQERLAAVLEVIYLIFNEGYSASSGDEPVRPPLCLEAQRLARVLAGLMPGDAEVQGLLALLELQASRLAARLNSTGETVLLADQDRRRWDRLMIRRGLAALERAEALSRGRLGAYGVQAAIAACHARAYSAAETNWARIAALYAVLAVLTPSPVIELNRGVALAMALGPQAGLDHIDAHIEPELLGTYHLLPAARADLLERLERRQEAALEYERAAGLCPNAHEQVVLRRRAEACRAN